MHCLVDPFPQRYHTLRVSLRYVDQSHYILLFSSYLVYNCLGHTTRTYSIFSTLFQGPISSEEKRWIEARLACMCFFFPSQFPLTPPLVAECSFNKHLSLSLLFLQQMIENNYAEPSYTADVFEKPDSWVDSSARLQTHFSPPT